MERISELVWLYIKRRPFLKEIIRERILNYSALARKISTEAFGTKKYEDAVKMALIRISNKLIKTEEDLEGKILKVLKGSSVSILSKVAVVTSTRELMDVDYLSFVEGKGFFTYIVEVKELEKVRKTKTILWIESNLNLISIHSPPSLEEIPGVISHILNALASEGINVVEFISCYTDTLLVVRESDTSRAYELLANLTK
ncbi:ACT domain-containing protein [Candidatus Micrarchaeota archaeon]|nr:ACT domain-containing protein [Candidatus Micrarchaeota archaeon]